MNILVTASQTLVGLFVDDGSLAIAILMIVLVSWIFSILMPDMPLVAGAILLVGCLAVLFANVMKAAQESFREWRCQGLKGETSASDH
jgi:NADH:ubiquinone oxidoreductase subunit 5 (subunit L)/multisubunit Na+/H+ antiporter MnhA subunit